MSIKALEACRYEIEKYLRGNKAENAIVANEVTTKIDEFANQTIASFQDPTKKQMYFHFDKHDFGPRVSIELKQKLVNSILDAKGFAVERSIIEYRKIQGRMHTICSFHLKKKD